MIPPGIFVNALILAIFAEFPQVDAFRPNPHSATTERGKKRDFLSGWPFRDSGMAEKHHARCNPAMLGTNHPFSLQRVTNGEEHA
jgi:hypothetical protein